MLGFTAVARRPIFHAEFGAYLADLRTQKGWSQSDAARYGGKKSKLLTRQVLLHLEAGKTKDPDPEALRALALLYDVPYEQIVAKLVACRYGIAPLSGSRQSVPNETAGAKVNKVESPVPVPARTEEIHESLVASTADLTTIIDRLSNDQRAAIRALTFRFASMLGDRPATTGSDTVQSKRPSTRRRVS